ncbi:MAG: hypothetical protein EPN53_03205 [Acidobacteria bacterium]|nr:MAG: hypothetical protein EPN53_03205 [Acidobacteriota bacterium]
MMKKSLLAAVLLSFAVLPAIAAAETWKNVPLIDHNCVDKVKSDPDQHETSCLIKCAKSGYGVLTSDGTWVKLDKKGNEEALAALKATTKTSGIRVTVEGERSGDMIKVSSLTID